MGSIAIKLNPQKLTNPDTDLCYIISNMIEKETSGKVTDNGYDYLDDEVTSMAIFLKSSSPKDDIAAVFDILKRNTFKGNQIYDIAEFFISDQTDEELDACDYDLSVYEQVPL